MSVLDLWAVFLFYFFFLLSNTALNACVRVTLKSLLRMKKKNKKKEKKTLYNKLNLRVRVVSRRI